MNGIGNDFIVIDNFNGKIKLSKEQICFLCDRHRGIGADGLILVESSAPADCFMNYYNSDGTQAEMCGNGVRCVAKFLKDFYLKSKNVFNIHTRAGTKEVTLEKDDIYSVNMGKPVFSHPDFPNISTRLENLDLNFVSVGNPHAVAFVDDLKDFDLFTIGPSIEMNSIFPNRINTELVKQKSKKEFEVIVWERGCGLTLACGTGATAVFAIARKNKIADEEASIFLPGGKLLLKENNDGEIIMSGEVETSFSGMTEII